jgi:predicted O-methyltransferase YrrM
MMDSGIESIFDISETENIMTKTIMPIVNPVNAPISHITGVPGWISEKEQALLATYSKIVPKDGLITQIGHECGLSTSLFAMFADKSVQIHSIDIDPRASDWTQHNLEATTLWRKGIVLHTADSAEINFVADIDLLFIDGLHTYRGVKNDLHRFAHQIISEGFLMLHDVACETNLNPHPLHHQVKKALDEYMDTFGDEWDFVLSCDSICVYRRK